MKTTEIHENDENDEDNSDSYKQGVGAGLAEITETKRRGFLEGVLASMYAPLGNILDSFIFPWTLAETLDSA